ncbi:acyl carrier protein [Parvibium lacunae]|uniref:Acyl carrier protein n=1 Tax=Parvibium lacunae TaxID=1888893 RepID=A0A368L1R6_9BURK|nr:acyl carrier protein [Parvibium lacunae]RCS57506.1 acyl carrier protein [Parvibium lacunae]
MEVVYKEAQDTVYGILSATFEIESARLTPDTRLIEDLDLDSIDLVELAIQLQDSVTQSVEVEQVRQVKTVGDVIDMLVKYKQH